MTDFEDAIKAGDETLHGAIDYWQDRCMKTEAENARLKEELGQWVGSKANDYGKQAVLVQRYREALEEIIHMAEALYLYQIADIAKQALEKAND